ncbi:beta-ketoacyl synthase [bacterium]|nr:beta-ketoacyl synthase [bacterium]
MSVYVAADNIITSLGFSTDENIENFSKGITGIKPHNDPERLGKPCCLSQVDSERIDRCFSEVANPKDYTRLEKIAILSIHDALKSFDIRADSSDTLFMVSTTKGNIDLLTKGRNTFGSDREQLWKAAQIIGSFFNNPNRPVVISNACISGALAITAASRLLETSRYKTVVVVGVDIASEFVIAGFRSFKALSEEPCKPYDANRNGLSLGEGCGTVILTSNPNGLEKDGRVVVRGGSSANDANHISGPSRTGEGLLLAINNTLKSAGERPENIDYISAHGTATVFNDDMESIAISRAGMKNVPVNSLKGYIGHTLGAAGVIESIVSIRSIRDGFLIATKGLEKKGVVEDINIIDTFRHETVNHSLKLASGFGGCNAGVLFSKDGTY